MQYKDENMVVIETNLEQMLPLQYLKNYLRIDNDCDDNFLLNALETAVNYAEAVTGKRFVTKVYKLTFQITEDVSKIDKTPILFDELIDICVDGTHLTYLDFELKNGIIFLKKNIIGSIEIIFKISSVGEIPADIKQAILFHVANIYQNKNGDCSVPKGAQEIYSLYRNVRI